MSSRTPKIRSVVAALAAYAALVSAHAAAPLLLRTQGYQAPVRAAPDDLLLLTGYGFHDGDRVVYQMLDARDPSKRPVATPSRDSAELGTAEIVHVGKPAYAITVRLPAVMREHSIYRLWVVTDRGEWSESVTINDPRPLWFTPSAFYSTADFAQLGRRIRVIGRNLAPASASSSVQIRLQGRSTYVIAAEPISSSTDVLAEYVAEAHMPARIEPGQYTVSVSRDNLPWIDVPEQKLVVRSDPAALPIFDLGDSRFGSCKPDDGADDSTCLIRAIEAARAVNGGTITIGPGTWHVALTRAQTDTRGDGIVLPPNVNLQGAGPQSSSLVRLDAQNAAAPAPMLTVSGHNSIAGLTFSEAAPFSSPAEGRRPTIQVGVLWSRASTSAGVAPPTVDDVIVTNNNFRRVGRALVSAGRPIKRLFIAHNEFGAYHTALVLTGDRANITQPFRTDDSVIRWNRFVPSSYIDLAAKQGTIATGLGAALRVDFSSNIADGTSTAGLQRTDDAHGFRAAFFWNLENNNEKLLVSENRVLCSGDKVGDGEAVSFDANGATLGFKSSPAVIAASSDSVTVTGELINEQFNHAVPATYYEGHWLTVVQGRGLGQSRRIIDYRVNAAAGTVTFHVSPRWDVPPAAGESRIFVVRQYWQAYVVANEVDQSSPPCRKGNLTAPRGGVIAMWAPSADSVIAGNHQQDTSGILFTQGFSVKTPSCTFCDDGGATQAALEIRDNVVDGEYDYDSDCSDSGIYGFFGASPTPEAPPPVGSLGVVIAHNEIVHADALNGGAIDITASWHRGPPPEDWPLVRNPLIFHNTIRNLTGTLPRNNCRRQLRARTGIRLDGPGSVRDAVLYGNHCERVDKTLDDAATDTRHICPPGSDAGCECSIRPQPPSAPRAQ